MMEMEHLVDVSPNAWCRFEERNYLKEGAWAWAWDGCLEGGLSGDGVEDACEETVAYPYRLGRNACERLGADVGIGSLSLVCGNAGEQTQLTARKPQALPAGLDHSTTLTSSPKPKHQQQSYSSSRSLYQNIRIDTMDDKELAMSQPTILPLHLKASEEHSNNLDSAETQIDDGYGSDAENPARAESSSQATATNAITMLPCEPTAPITSPLPLSETPYQLLAAHHPTSGRLYKISALPGKGLGMRATCHIPSGTRLLAETPVLTVYKRDWAYDTTQRTAVISTYLTLPQPYVELFDALTHTDASFAQWHTLIEQEYSDAQPFGPSDPPRAVPFDGQLGRIAQARVMATLSTNAFGVDGSRDGIAAAICPEASRINHSCTPNMQFAWNDNVLGGAITMHATRAIAPGEEITAGYIDLYKASTERQELLSTNYGFDCGCVVCGAGEAAVRVSDCRREMIRAGLAKVRAEREDYEPGRKRLGGEARELLEGVARLHEEEGLWGLNYGNVFHLGTAPDNRAYAEQYLAVLVRCLGTDHKWTKRQRRQMREMEQWERREKERMRAILADARAAEGDGEEEEDGKEDVEEEEEAVVVRAESSSMGAAREVKQQQGEEKEEDKHTIAASSSDETGTEKSPNALIQQLPRFKQTARKSTGIPQGDDGVDDDDDDADDDGDEDRHGRGGGARKRRKTWGEGGHDQGDDDDDESDGLDGEDEDAVDEKEGDWDTFDKITITRRGVSRSFRLVPIDDAEELDDGYSRRRAGQNSFPPSRPAAASSSSASAPRTRQTARKVPSSYQCDGTGDSGEDDDGESDSESDSESDDSDSDDAMEEEEEDNTTGGPYLMAKHVMAAKKTSFDLLPYSVRPPLASRLAAPQQQQQRSSVFRFDGDVLTSTPAYVPTAAADGARKTASSTSPPTGSSSSVPGEQHNRGYMPAELRDINARREEAGLPRLQTARKRTGARAPVGVVDDDDEEEEDDEDEDEDEDDETERIVLWTRDGSGRGYRPERG